SQAGVESAFVDTLIDRGVLTPDETCSFTPGSARAARVIRDLERSGLPLERTGLRAKVTTPPAMCFLDLSGFTRLTDERGDDAAAEMAVSLSRLVQRAAHEHGGRIVKRLGDGVMLYFNQPADALVGSLEMAERVPAAGLPQAHVGVDAGP